jgi:hypothetical protein
MAFPSVSWSDMTIGGQDPQFKTHNLTFKSVVSGHMVTFVAFLTDYSQNFSSNWSSEEVYGRADPLATYQGTKRTISLAWDVPARSISEAKNNMRLINSLVAMLYPGYSSQPVTQGEQSIINASSISRSPLIKVKYKNLIQDANSDTEGLLGYVDGFSVNTNLDMGMFDQDGDNVYPKVFSISCNFNVLHQHDLGFDKNNEWLDGDAYKKFVFGDE